ncbi:MAG TPA: hypothetical protein VGB00_18940 [Pyrinomonadaceae bacterium]
MRKQFETADKRRWTQIRKSEKIGVHLRKSAVALLVLITLFVQSVSPVFACGPSYITPVFDYKHAPEEPFENFAAGKIGIVKPEYYRVVLFAAYRYLNGGAFSPDEQKGLVDVWKAEFENKSFDDTDVSEAVKMWVERRKEIVKEEENPPSIYTERETGGYDFFPNCTKSAFETAAQTLSDRITSYGAEDKNVQAWLKAQDQVFMNCASGQAIPEQAALEAPEWLKKDREYQIAAANFYSLNYAAAREVWTRIADDSDSVWSETSDYLIARTLVREASLAKSLEQSEEIYQKAEEHLYRLTGRGGKFYGASLKLLNLIKYRLHPEQRVRELAQTLTVSGGNDNFRQDLIDYYWLLDKFEKQAREAEDKRKEELKKQEEAERGANANVNSQVNSTVDANSNSSGGSTTDAANTATSATTETVVPELNYEQVQQGAALGFPITLSENNNLYFRFSVSKTDAEIYEEVEREIGRKLTEKEKEAVREARRESYRNKTSNRTYEDYQGGYSGSEKTTLALLPDFLRQDELTDWLFTYQIRDESAYEHSLTRWRQTKSDLWLMTALTKAETGSNDLKRLLEEALTIDRSAPVYPTVAYHTARIYIEQKKFAEARRLLDDILNSSMDLPVSTRNQFLQQRMSLAATLDEFLIFAQRKPFGFDFEGSTGTIEQFIAEQKSWYNPQHYPDQTREEYEREVEERFKDEKEWQNRLMFDEDAVEIINQHFPLTVLLEAEKSPALPEYLQKRLALAIWTRAILLENDAAARKISPEVVRLAPEFGTLFAAYQNAATPLERKRAALFFILKNPVLTPIIKSGMGKTDNETGEFDIDDWWCTPYDSDYDEEGENVGFRLPARPSFLTKAQSDAAQAERAKLKEIGDAPKFLAEAVLEWQKLAPADKRVPEMLYITYKANGWTKYGCGNNEELRAQIAKILKTRYPKSKWTIKMIEEET